jgi:hypothetical protein
MTTAAKLTEMIMYFHFGGKPGLGGVGPVAAAPDGGDGDPLGLLAAFLAKGLVADAADAAAFAAARTADGDGGML